jgi:hypothetical protein
LLSVALSCFEQNKKQQYFFPRKRKEKKRNEEKKICLSHSNGAAAVKVFWKNTTRSAAEVWRFFQKPAGLDLYCRVSGMLSLHHLFCGQNITARKILRGNAKTKKKSTVFRGGGRGRWRC